MKGAAWEFQPMSLLQALQLQNVQIFEKEQIEQYLSIKLNVNQHGQRLNFCLQIWNPFRHLHPIFPYF